MKRPDSRLVYTSDPEEAKRLRNQAAPESADLPPASQQIRVSVDRKRRRGKIVTVASGFQLTAQTLAHIAGDLKKLCGAGGKSGDGEIEIQGDHAGRVADALSQQGFRVRRL